MHPPRGSKTENETASADRLAPACAPRRWFAGALRLLVGTAVVTVVAVAVVEAAPATVRPATSSSQIQQTAVVHGLPSAAPLIASKRKQRHGSKATIGLFTATPAKLSAHGGKVRLMAVVQNAKMCRFTSAEALKQLPAAKDCAAGSASVSVVLPKNTTRSARTYRFALAARGASGSASAGPALVVESAPGSSTAAPLITTEPASASVVAGSSVTFAATAAGASTTVQWQLSTNGGGTWLDIVGATSPRYTLTATAAENGYEFRAVFAIGGRAATTTAAKLTVEQGASAPASVSQPSATTTASANTAPQITLQPQSESVVKGSPVTFSAGASGTPEPTVQWQVLEAGAGSWTDISGATATSYSFTPTTDQDGNQYRAVFTNAVGSVVSAAATLGVTASAQGPSVVLDPEDDSVPAGSPATFTASASGSPTPVVQWRVSTDNGFSWAPIPGANSPSYSFTAVPAQSGYEYEAVFTNSAGSATSTPATLTVTPAPVAPVVSVQPINLSAQAGAGVSFTAQATGYPQPSVEWEVSTDGTHWAPIANATSNSYSFVATAGDNGNQYRAVFTNSAGTAITNPATLTVAVVPVAPVVTQQPANQAVISGGNVTFTAAASGEPTPTVQWEVSTDGGGSWGNVTPNGTSPSLTFTATGENGYEYRAVFTNSVNSATTNPATLTVGSDPSTGNWSGYAATAGGGAFTQVTGTWTVPIASCPDSSTSYSSAWIGIDGDGSNSVEQDGTDSDCTNGVPTYYAWYEMYGDSAVNGGASVPLAANAYGVSPGNVMSATVSLTGSGWMLSIDDLSSGWTSSNGPFPFNANQSSAEWIVERPQVGGALTALTDFGTASFSTGSAVVNGQNKQLSALGVGPIEMASGSELLALPGPLSGSSFSDTWYGSG